MVSIPIYFLGTTGNDSFDLNEIFLSLLQNASFDFLTHFAATNPTKLTKAKIKKLVRNLIGDFAPREIRFATRKEAEDSPHPMAIPPPHP